jgi:uncharacterized protein (DUF362 family)
MDRRRFLVAAACGLGSLHAARALPLRGLPPDEPYDLALVKHADTAAAVAAAVDALGGIGRFVKPGAVVLLKPNMSFPNPPEWGSTTHPAVIDAVTTLCAGAGAKRIIITDYPMSRAAQCFERSGLNALLAARRELTFVELKEETQFEPVELPRGEEVKTLAVAKLLRKADVFINLPTAKAHSATGVSFGLKNLMGLFWERYPFHRTYNLHNAVADLATIMRPQLTLLDARFALLTNGPQGPGKSAQLDTIVAGVDPVAVDAAGCGLGEWNNRSTSPDSVEHIAHAARRGLGTMDLSSLRIFRQG